MVRRLFNADEAQSRPKDHRAAREYVGEKPERDAKDPGKLIDLPAKYSEFRTAYDQVMELMTTVMLQLAPLQSEMARQRQKGSEAKP